MSNAFLDHKHAPIGHGRFILDFPNSVKSAISALDRLSLLLLVGNVLAKNTKTFQVGI